jgi:hypothetical protein
MDRNNSPTSTMRRQRKKQKTILRPVPMIVIGVTFASLTWGTYILVRNDDQSSDEISEKTPICPIVYDPKTPGFKCTQQYINTIKDEMKPDCRCPMDENNAKEDDDDVHQVEMSFSSLHFSAKTKNDWVAMGVLFTLGVLGLGLLYKMEYCKFLEVDDGRCVFIQAIDREVFRITSNRYATTTNQVLTDQPRPEIQQSNVQQSTENQETNDRQSTENQETNDQPRPENRHVSISIEEY